ncbi:hypothetical protein AB0B50_00500 [Streptomyces sp. NPDC041068]|uniref:hypothetical protein n=1 Tax=Streptomyces sp. NPDC041068 TaxID=3155130 RepID=UPI00340F96A6
MTDETIDPGAHVARATTGLGWADRGLGTVQKLGFGQQEVPVTLWRTANGPTWATMHWSKADFAARPGSEAVYSRLGGASRALGAAGGALNACAHAVEQWKRDGELPHDLDPVERHARSVYRGAVVGGSGYAGGYFGAAGGSVLAAAGASAYSAFLSGAALGTMAAPGPGTVVCAVLGGIGGGIAGGVLAAKGADMLVDRTIDAVGTEARSATGRMRERLNGVRKFFG